MVPSAHGNFPLQMVLHLGKDGTGPMLCSTILFYQSELQSHYTVCVFAGAGFRLENFYFATTGEIWILGKILNELMVQLLHILLRFLG